MLLPATDADEALDVAERLRSAIAGRPWPHRKVTASLGVATLGPATADAAALVDQADRALYHSKQAGRNQVTHFRSCELITTPVVLRSTSPRLHGWLREMGLTPSVLDARTLRYVPVRRRESPRSSRAGHRPPCRLEFRLRAVRYEAGIARRDRRISSREEARMFPDHRVQCARSACSLVTLLSSSIDPRPPPSPWRHRPSALRFEVRLGPRAPARDGAAAAAGARLDLGPAAGGTGHARVARAQALRRTDRQERPTVLGRDVVELAPGAAPVLDDHSAIFPIDRLRQLRARDLRGPGPLAHQPRPERSQRARETCTAP